MSEKNSGVLRLALPFSLLCLALAIAYFSYALLSVATALPPLIDKLDSSSSNIQPMLEEAAKITTLVPQILDETKAIRDQIPPILEEFKAIRATVPGILKEWSATRTETIPLVIAETGKVREAIPPILVETKSYREKTIPEILKESEQIRATIPPTLNRTEAIVSQAQNIASSAGENAVTGLFAGIIKAPVSLISDVTGRLIPEHYALSKSEKAIVESSVADIVHTGTTGETRNFSSTNSELKGKVTLLSDYNNNKENCRRVKISLQKSKKSLPDQTADICKDEKGVWKLKK